MNMERETWRDEHGETVSGDFNEDMRNQVDARDWRTGDDTYRRRRQNKKLEEYRKHGRMKKETIKENWGKYNFRQSEIGEKE